MTAANYIIYNLILLPFLHRHDEHMVFDKRPERPGLKCLFIS